MDRVILIEDVQFTYWVGIQKKRRKTVTLPKGLIGVVFNDAQFFGNNIISANFILKRGTRTKSYPITTSKNNLRRFTVLDIIHARLQKGKNVRSKSNG